MKVFCASHNKLTEFPEMVFDVTSLQCLDVSFNCLKSISLMSSKKVPLRKTFTLEESHIPKQILTHHFSLKRTKSELGRIFHYVSCKNPLLQLSVYLSVSLSLSLTVCLLFYDSLSVNLSIYLSVFFICVWLCMCFGIDIYIHPILFQHILIMCIT